MKKLPRIKRDSLYTKLFVSFLMIILPIQLLGYFIFKQSNNALENEIRNTAAANGSLLTDQFDGEILGIVDQLNLLINASDTTIQKFYVESGTYSENEYWMMLREIITKLTLLKHSRDSLYDIILYYPTLDLMVSTLSGVQAIDDDNYAQNLAAFYKQGMLLTDNGTSLFVGKLYPSISYWQSDQEENETIVFLTAVLLKKVIPDYLSAFSTYSGYPTAMINYNADTILFDMVTQETRNIEGFNPIIPTVGNSDGITWTLQTNYYVVSSHSSYSNCSFVQYLPLDELFRVPRRFSVYNLIFILLSVPVLFIYSVIIYRLVKHPIDQLVKAFRIMRNGNFDVQLQISSPSSEFDLLIGDFNEMTAKLGTLINQVIKQEIYTKQTELKQLQSQINPHFLYNNFFTLSHLIQEEDIPTATRLANYLGEYFQYITKTGIAHVPLHEEYAHAETYMKIQQMRYFNRLQVIYPKLPDQVANILVPRLILQPILENTLEHGVKAKTENGMIRMTFEDDGETLHITTEDNGENLDDDTLNKLRDQLQGNDPVVETTGLINIHRRLQLTFGKAYGITVDRSILGGLRVDMRLPKKREGNRECNFIEY